MLQQQSLRAQTLHHLHNTSHHVICLQKREQRREEGNAKMRPGDFGVQVNVSEKGRPLGTVGEGIQRMERETEQMKKRKEINKKREVRKHK